MGVDPSQSVGETRLEAGVDDSTHKNHHCPNEMHRWNTHILQRQRKLDLVIWKSLPSFCQQPFLPMLTKRHQNIMYYLSPKEELLQSDPWIFKPET